MMDDSELIHAVELELERSSTGTSSEFQTWREESARYYRLPPKPSAIKGRSDAESPDIQSMVDQTMAQIMPRFQREILAEYPALAAADADLAHSETVAVNNLVLHECEGYEAISAALFDAILSMVGACIVYWDVSERVTVEDVQNEAGLMPRHPLEKIELASDPQAPGPLRVRRRMPKGQLKIDPIPLAQLRLAGDADNLDPDSHRFIGYESAVSADALIAQGIDPDLVDQLPSADKDADLEDGRDTDYDLETAHRSTRNVKVTSCWYKIDFDGDGRAERRHIRLSGKYLLFNEEVSDEVDIVLGTGFRQPHRPYGWSFYNKLKHTQDTKRVVLRQMIDNGQLAVDHRWLVEEGSIDLKQAQVSRPGGYVFARPGRIDGVKPLIAPDTMGSALPVMQYMDKIRSETGGNALDMSGENSPVPGSTAHGVERIVTAREQLVSDISETFARSFLRKLFVVVHRVLRRNGAPLEIEINGQLQQVSAATLPERDNVNVSLGPSMAQRMQRQQALTDIVMRQMTPEAQAMGLTTPDRIYKALVDLGDAMELPAAEEYWLDPASPEAMQMQQQRQQQEAMQMQQAQQAQMMQVQIMQMQIELEQMKLLQKDQESKREVDFDYAKLAEETYLKEQEIELKDDELELKYNE